MGSLNLSFENWNLDTGRLLPDDGWHGTQSQGRPTRVGQGKPGVGPGGAVPALTLVEALAGVGGPAGQAVAEGPLEAVVLLGQLLDGLLQVDALLLLILQRPLPFPAVCLC